MAAARSKRSNICAFPSAIRRRWANGGNELVLHGSAVDREVAPIVDAERAAMANASLSPSPFVAMNANKLPALLVVTQRPRDLTREDLRKLKLALDQEFKTDGGFAGLNKVFDGQLETMLGELAEEVWNDVG
jgi:hypothetical protein